MKFTLLASGSKGNACLIETQTTKVLIDCGTTKKYLSGRFDERKLLRKDLDALVLTHSHSDHIQQLKHFFEVPTYSPFEVADYPRSYEVVPYLPFEIGDLTFTPIELSHDTDITVGYVVNNHIEKLVYITDTGYIKSSDYQLLGDADYIILESNHDSEMLMNTNRPYPLKMRIISDRGHLSNEESGLVLQEILSDKTKHIVLAHLSEEANKPAIALQTVSSYLPHYKGKLQAANQFEIITGGSL